MAESALPALVRERGNLQGELRALRLVMDENRRKGWDSGELNQAEAQRLSDAIADLTTEIDRIYPDPIRPERRSTRT